MARETSAESVQLSTDRILEESGVALLTELNSTQTSTPWRTSFHFASTSEKLIIWLACGLFAVVGSGTILQTYYGTKSNVALAFADGDTVLNSVQCQLIVVGVVFVVGAIAAFLIEWTAEKQIRTMRTTFFRSLLEKDQAWYDTHDINKLNADIEVSVVQVRDGIGLKLGEMIKNTSVFLLGTAMAFAFHWQLTLVLSVTIPLLGFALSLVVRRINKLAFQAKAEYATAGAVAEEALSNIRTVQAFGLENTFLTNFTRQLDVTLIKELASSLMKGTGVGFIRLLIYACNALGWWYGGRFVRDSIAAHGKEGRHLARNVMTAFFAIIKAGTNLNYIAPGLACLSIAAAAAGSIKDVIGDTQKKSHTRVASPPAKRLRGEIEFRNVSFAYPKNPERPIYNKVTFTIKPGETIALVGPSGCGKSTAIQLVQRFYDLDDSEGDILIDGISIKDYDIVWLREQMALVSQEPRLFCKTIAENIRFGRLDATDAEVREAALAANADHFINNLTEGYQTSAGLGGGLLSGGQKQRVAIARAILRDPGILILDEATSALDNVSEKIVQRALDKLLAERQRTTIIIAHRLSTIRNADRILVLNNDSGEGSRVVECGSHEELMEIENGLYRRLVNMQETQDDEEKQDLSETMKSDGLAASHELASHDLRSAAESSLKLEPTADEICAVPSIDKPVRRLWLLQLTLHPGQFIGSALASAVIGGVQSASGLMLGWWQSTFLIYDDSQSAYDNSVKMFKEAKLISYVYIGIAIAFGVAQFFEAWLSDRISHLIVREMRERVFSSMLHQEIQFFDIPQYNVGFLQQVLSSDCELAKTITGQNFSICVQALFCLILGISLSFHFSWKVAAPLLGVYCIIIPMVFVQTQTLKSTSQQLNPKKMVEKKRFCRKSKKAKSAADELVTPQFLSNELVNNLKTIIAFNLQGEFLKDFEKAVEADYIVGRRNACISAIAVGVTECAIILAVAVGYYINYRLLMKGEFEYRSMIMALLCMFLACNGTTRTAAFTTDAHRARSAASNVFTITAKESSADSRNPHGKTEFRTDPPPIDINHIKFRYPSRPNQPILSDVNFSIPPNKTVALVGESGCGKSTIIQFLMRFYDLYPASTKVPSEIGHASGSVTLEGVDIQDYNLKFLRSQIGLVSQEPILFNTTVAENIAYGSPHADRSAIEQAARAANADDFIRELPDGYETCVGRQGSLLSGGQKQRIAIARALVRNPKILLLDEATSALDPESEKVVQAALDTVLKKDQQAGQGQGRTTIMIAHRLSTIRNADVIIVFKAIPGQGSVIAEIGNHDELMRVPQGIYANLVAIAS